MINSSSMTAVFKIARNMRYDLATIVADTPASSSPAPTPHRRGVELTECHLGQRGGQVPANKRTVDVGLRGRRRGCWLIHSSA